MEDSFNDSSLFIYSDKKIGESNNEKQFFEEDSQNYKINSNYKNESLGDNKASLSLHSDNEKYLNLYKIQKLKNLKTLYPKIVHLQICDFC